MIQMWTSSAIAILGLGPGVQTAGAHYDKQFGPLPSSQLWNILLVIGYVVLLAGFAAWFFMSDGKGKPKSKKPKGASGEGAAATLPVISKKRIHPRKSRKERAKNR